MFHTSKEELIKGLNVLQGERCIYGGGDFCDCKYGYKGFVSMSAEQNCCPELRSVVVLLELMTEEEYKTILNRTV